jgi:hypothetical protein
MDSSPTARVGIYVAYNLIRGAISGPDTALRNIFTNST